MNRFHPNTEERILRAAEEIFVRRGYEAVRLEEIAEQSGVNKSALHYYFRSKDKLFEIIFEKVLFNYLSEICRICIKNDHIQLKIEDFVSDFTDSLNDNPHTSLFILNEVNRKPERIQQIVRVFTIVFDIESLENTSLRNFDTKIISLLINFLSLYTFHNVLEHSICSNPFTSDPIDCKKFLEDREKEISIIIVQSIKNHQNKIQYEKDEHCRINYS